MVIKDQKIIVWKGAVAIAASSLRPQRAGLPHLPQRIK
jgi:hypothetical protein